MNTFSLSSYTYKKKLNCAIAAYKEFRHQQENLNLKNLQTMHCVFDEIKLIIVILFFAASLTKQEKTSEIERNLTVCYCENFIVIAIRK